MAGAGWDPPGPPTPYSGPHCDISSENMAPTAPSTRHSILEFQIATSHPAPVMYYKLYGCSGSRRRLKSFRKPQLQGCYQNSKHSSAVLGWDINQLYLNLKLNHSTSSVELNWITGKFQLIRSRPGLIQIVGVIPLQSQEREAQRYHNINETIKSTKECSHRVGVVAGGGEVATVLR